MNGFLQSLRNLGPVRLAALGGAAVATLLFFVFITARFSAEPMAVLFNNVSAAEGGAIISRLEQLNVPFNASADGSRISVPEKELGRVKLLLAEDGLPSGGGVGYEIFNKAEGFGTTSFLQNVNQQRALEGELARTIRTIGQIRNARVQLVLPRRELFARQANESRASVFVEVKAGMTLDREQIRAIQHLVSSAVPQLEPSRVAIIDSRGSLLASGAGSNSVSEAQNTAEEQRLAIEQRLAQRIEEIIGSTVGFGKVRAQVTAELDMDSVTTQSEIFDPEQQVARSTQSVTEEKQESEPGGGADTSVTLANNLPGGEANPADTGTTAAPVPTAKSSRTEETTNFEISKKVQSQTRLPGGIKRLSVAVLVDGTYKTEGEGDESKEVYSPRTAEELEKFAALVRSAVGYDANRGDVVEVQNLQFAQDNLAGDTPSVMGLDLDETRLMRIAELGVLALLGVLVILLVVRPLMNRLLEAKPDSEDEAKMLGSAYGNTPQLASPGQSALAADLAAEAEAAAESMIDISQVDGRVKASSLKKMGEIIDKHPEEAVAIIRQWIYAET